MNDNRTIDKLASDLGYTRAYLIDAEIQNFMLNHNLTIEAFTRDYALVEQGEPLVFEGGTVRLNKNWRIVRKDELDKS